MVASEWKNGTGNADWFKRYQKTSKRYSSDGIRDSIGKCSLSDAVKEDMLNFIEKFHVTDAELKNLKIKGLKEADMVERLQKC